MDRVKQAKYITFPGYKISYDDAYASVFWAPLIVMGLFLSACGGGSSSGGVPVSVTAPPIVTPPTRLSLSYGPSYDAEYDNQRGLEAIGAATAYEAGYAGFGVRLAVVDTGVDGSHDELTAIQPGHDFHSDSHGLIDPDGHGTHVASLIAAQRNESNMHGVSPYADVLSYRIFNDSGSFGSKTGSEIMPELVSHALSDDVSILDNSWASHYEITDFSRSTIQAVLGDELNAWRDAVSQGLVMVWSAGNDGADDVSVRAGLPHHFSELTPGWLAVVAVDVDGYEPRYSNRCGLARNWCLTAPGGGDDVARDGIYGAKSGGGYEMRSGTSMASPHITGALALIQDAFPQLSSQQAAIRLLETATYEGLTTADGCTIDSCTPSQMAEVFGQGRVSLKKALAPIGTLSLQASAAPASLKHTYLDTGFVIDEALFSAMTTVQLKASDSFDGAAFAIPATALLTQPSASFLPLSSGVSRPSEASIYRFSFQDHEKNIPWHASRESSSGTSYGYISQSGHFPHLPGTKARLFDISLKPLQRWAGLSASQAHAQWQVHFGFDDDRQLMVMHRQQGVSDHFYHWLTMGADMTTGRFMDSQGQGGLQWGKGHSQWLTLGSHQDSAIGSLSAEFQTGQSQVFASSNCLICEGRAIFHSWRFAFQPRLAVSESATWDIALSQPLAVQQFDLSLTGANTDRIRHKPTRPRREISSRLSLPSFAGGTLNLTHYLRPTSQARPGKIFGDQAIAVHWQLSL